MQKPQKVASALAVLLVLIFVSSFFCGSILQFETDRFARIESSDSILFVVRGICPCPLTVEGPFPKWSDATRAKFKSTNAVQLGQPAEYNLGHDFTVQYGALESGQISIDPINKTAVLTGKYTREYQSSRVMGKFPITN
jgi:hypothetical protein